MKLSQKILTFIKHIYNEDVRLKKPSKLYINYKLIKNKLSLCNEK